MTESCDHLAVKTSKQFPIIVFTFLNIQQDFFNRKKTARLLAMFSEDMEKLLEGWKGALNCLQAADCS